MRGEAESPPRNGEGDRAKRVALPLLAIMMALQASGASAQRANPLPEIDRVSWWVNHVDEVINRAISEDEPFYVFSVAPSRTFSIEREVTLQRWKYVIESGTIFTQTDSSIPTFCEAKRRGERNFVICVVDDDANGRFDSYYLTTLAVNDGYYVRRADHILGPFTVGNSYAALPDEISRAMFRSVDFPDPIRLYLRLESLSVSRSRAVIRLCAADGTAQSQGLVDGDDFLCISDVKVSVGTLPIAFTIAGGTGEIVAIDGKSKSVTINYRMSQGNRFF